MKKVYSFLKKMDWRYISPVLLSSLVSILVVLVLFHLLKPVKTIEIYNSPVPILNPGGVVHRGEVLQYRVSFHKYTNIAPRIGRTLICYVDGDPVVKVVTSNLDLSRAGRTPDNVDAQLSDSLSYIIPEQAPYNATCTLQIVSIFDFVFQSDQKEFTTTEFRIIP